MTNQARRILHVTTSYPRSTEDHSGIFVSQLVHGLLSQGLSCQVLTPASQQDSAESRSSGVNRFRYAPSRWQRVAQQPGGIPQALAQTPSLRALLPGLLLSMGLHIVDLARKNDVIHAHWSVCGAIAVLTRHFHRKPVITTLRGSDTQLAKTNGAYSWINRTAVLGSRFTVGVSHAIVKEIRERHTNVSNRFVAIPNGVGDSFYGVSSAERPSRPPMRFLFVGSLTRNKGVDVLLEALARIGKNKEWLLTLAGDGPEMETLQRTARALKLSDRTSFLGAVPHSAVPALMTNHHVLVLPSHKEGRPNVVLEALAAALPVVGTAIDGTTELVKHDETGWLTTPGDSSALAEVFDSLLRNEKDPASTGAAGRKWMLRQGWTWAYTAQKYRELYDLAARESAPQEEDT